MAIVQYFLQKSLRKRLWRKAAKTQTKLEKEIDRRESCERRWQLREHALETRLRQEDDMVSALEPKNQVLAERLVGFEKLQMVNESQKRDLDNDREAAHKNEKEAHRVEVERLEKQQEADRMNVLRLERENAGLLEQLEVLKEQLEQEVKERQKGERRCGGKETKCGGKGKRGDADGEREDE